MAGIFEIKSGGRIRANFPILTGQTWEKGTAIIVNSGGYLQQYAGQSNVLIGPSLEKCVSTSTGNPTSNTSTVVAGQTGSILMSESMVVTDNLSGTGGWVPGASTVYAAIGGNYTYTSTSGVAVGQALSNPASNGRLTFFYRPNLP